MSKKTIVIILFIVLYSGILYPQTKSNISVVVLPSQVENLSTVESSWVPGIIRDRLISNLSQLTRWTFVDDTNETQIKLLQKKYETSLYSSSIEIGKLTSAQYGIFTTVRKTGNTYSLSCNFTNLKLGTSDFSSTVSGKKYLSDIYDGAGCAVNEVTIKICDALGIKISASQRYVLENGDVDLSIEEKLQKEKNDEAYFSSLMKELDSQIDKLSYSTNISASAEQKKLEAQRVMAEEKLKSAQTRRERLLAEQTKEREDKIKDAERSAEQKIKRDALAKKVAEKADSVRKASVTTQSILGSIKILENKKHTLLEIRQNIYDRICDEQTLLDKECQKKLTELENKPYRVAELSMGYPSDDAKAARKKQKKNLINEYEKKKKETETNILKSVKPQTSLLEKEIEKDYITLAKTKTSSSISGDVKVSFNIYDGNRKSWTAEILFFSDDVLLLADTIEIKYENLTGKNIPKYTSDSYNNFLDTVDMYESLFSRGEQVLLFEVDYHAKPLSEKKPSRYEIKFTEIRVIDMLTKKTVAKNYINKSVEKGFTPINDMRDREIIEAEKVREE